MIDIQKKNDEGEIIKDETKKEIKKLQQDIEKTEGKSNEKELSNLKKNIEKKEISPLIEEIKKKIDTTENALPKSKYESLIGAIKTGKIGEIIKNFGSFVSLIFEIIFSGKGVDGKIIEGGLDIRKINFNEYGIYQLAGDPQNPNEKLNFDEKGQIIPHEKSILSILEKEKKNASLPKEIMYTATLSKAKDTFYAKYNKRKESGGKDINPNITLEELEDKSRKEQFKRLSQNIQPGDMIFFIDGSGLKWFDKALQSISSIPAQHVGIVGENEPPNLFHSTMKKYETGRNGVHNVSLQEEIESRNPPLKLLIARPNRDKKITQEVIISAQKLENEKRGYSQFDAASSILGLGNNIDGEKLNCGDFVNECYKASPLYEGVKNAGIPSNLLINSTFTTEYIMEYF